MSFTAKPLTILFGSLVLLGAIWTHDGAYASGGAKQENKTGHASGEKGDDEKSKAAPTDSTLVSMPPIIVPVTRNGVLVGYLYVGVILKAEDEARANDIKKAMPLVQDAALRAMNGHPVPVEHAEDDGTKDLIVQQLEASLAHIDGVPPIKMIKIHDILKVPF